MTRRFPLWAAILPLLFGILAYWLYWEREAEAFRQAVIAAVPGTAKAEIGGFPYRIEARLAKFSVQSEHDDLMLALSSGATVINRQPWRTGHVVVAAQKPNMNFSVPSILGADLRIEAPAMLASVRRPGETLQRLSMQFPKARLWLPVVGGPFEATELEVHIRETPAKAGPQSSPTPPVQAEARLVGKLGHTGGASFGIDLPLFVTAATRIASVGDWQSSGTVEIKGGILTDTRGKPVAGFDVTLAPLPEEASRLQEPSIPTARLRFGL